MPDAHGKLVLDQFHIMHHVATAVEQVRKQEHKALLAAGDQRLTHTKYDWLKHPGNAVGAARAFVRGWYEWAMRSRLEPMKKVARMRKAHLESM